jgi:hypothetical protein
MRKKADSKVNPQSRREVQSGNGGLQPHKEQGHFKIALLNPNLSPGLAGSRLVNDHGVQAVITCRLKLYLDLSLLSPFIVNRKKDFPQPFTPRAHVLLERRTVSQHLQNIAGFHVWSLHRDLKNRLGALQAKGV